MGKLGILFDINKLDDVLYGSVAWDIFWGAIGAEGLPDGDRLYEGDTAATLDGRENVYCIAIESENRKILDHIRTRLAGDEAYLAVAFGERFIDTDAVNQEPLPLMGHFEKGQIVGEHAINPRSALAKLRSILRPPPESASLPVSERSRPASTRSAELPVVANLDELIEVLGQYFPGEGHEMRFSLTPEELCDVVERYMDVFDVYWHVGVATVAEASSFVNFMPRGRRDSNIMLFGLMEFPSREDALRYCERESITPKEWGLHGSLVHNFVGLKMVDTMSADHLAPYVIRPDELWPRICGRQIDLKISGSVEEHPKTGLIETAISNYEMIDIDGNKYKAVKIGEQIWTAENLKVGHFRNGDKIPRVKTDFIWKRRGRKEKPAWCHYDNDPVNEGKYGRLYNWFAVNDPRCLCPEGWHVPANEEVRRLVEYLGGDWYSAYIKLKSIRAKPDPHPRWDDNPNRATNESGFSGLPGGVRDENGKFFNIGYFGYWWSSMVKDTVCASSFYLGAGTFGINSNRSRQGLSVRCVKD